MDAVGNWGGMSVKLFKFSSLSFDKVNKPLETDVMANVWFKSAITAANESERVKPTGWDVVVGVDVPLALGESDAAAAVATVTGDGAIWGAF